MKPVARLWGMSDIHTDTPQNMEFIDRVHPEKYKNDALIVAGDISHRISVMRQTLRSLRRKFEHVFFVPGNHELWLMQHSATSTVDEEELGIEDSLQKIQAIERMCEQEDVQTQPRRLPLLDGAGHLWVVPLLSWHCQSFDAEPEIDVRWEGIPEADQLCTDYHVCKWPQPLSAAAHGSDAIAEHVDRLNLDRAARAGAAELLLGQRDQGDVVASFSHFLPRQELLPEKRYLYFPTLAKFVGSPFLGRRVSQLQPDVHVFGHTHFGWDAVLDGVRYLSAPLAMPRERSRRLGSIATGHFPQDEPGHSVEPLLVWDSSLPGKGLPAPYPAAWSGYYREQPRRPELVTVLPEYVAANFEWDERRHGPKADVVGWGDVQKPFVFAPKWTQPSR